MKEVIDIPEENIYDIPTEQMGDEIANVTTWTTAHPDAKHVLCFGHSDLPGVNCALALEQAGYLGNAAAASLGASDEALVDLRTRTDAESIFKATISYFPERYGEQLIPAIVDMLEGKTVPEKIISAFAARDPRKRQRALSGTITSVGARRNALANIAALSPAVPL